MADGQTEIPCLKRRFATKKNILSYTMNVVKKGLKRIAMHEIIIIQGSKGIRQWSINLYTSPMIIYKIIPSVDYD